MGNIDPRELDRHITGNYGEDQFRRPSLPTFAGVTLERRCEECDGEQMIQHPAWREWFAATGGDEAKAPMPEPEIPEEVPCPECDGRGTILSEEGITLMHLVNRYIGKP